MSRGCGLLADPVPVGALLEETVKFVTGISLAKDTKFSPPPAAKAAFFRLKLWKQSYHTEKCPLDIMLSYAPTEAETVLILLCNFIAVVLEEFGYRECLREDCWRISIALTCSQTVAEPGAISKLKVALGELGLVSDIDDDLSEHSSAQCNLDPNDSLQAIGQRGDDGSNHPGAMELLQTVDALFDLAPALDERIDQILERQKTEMLWDLPVDLRAIVVTVASKFPRAPDRLVLVVAQRILENRNRLQGKKIRGKPVAANPETLRLNAPTLSRGAHSQGGFDRDSGLGSSLGPSEKPSRFGLDTRSQQNAQTSVPLMRYLLVPPVDESTTASSLASSVCSDSGKAQLVQRPACGSDGYFKCGICQQSLSIANDQDWK